MKKTLLSYIILFMLVVSSFCLVLKVEHHNFQENYKQHKIHKAKHFKQISNSTVNDKKMSQLKKAQAKKQIQSNPQLSWFKNLQPETQNQFIDIVIGSMNEKKQNKRNVLSSVLINKKIGPVVAQKLWKSEKGIDQNKVNKVKKDFPEFKDLDFNQISTDKKIQILLRLNQSGWLKQNKQK